MDGRITAASTNGPIVGRGLSGSVDASTVNGGIEIGLRSLSGDSKIVTVNGPATLILATGLGAEIDASAVNGGVTTQDSLPLTASDRTGRRVAGRLNGGGPRITVQTTNGGGFASERAMISRAGADLDARTWACERISTCKRDKATRYHRIHRRASILALSSPLSSSASSSFPAARWPFDTP